MPLYCVIIYSKSTKQLEEINDNFKHFPLLRSRYVLSSRVRTGRAIRGIPHPPVCSRAERREVERVVTDALKGLPSDLAGQYYSLKGMTEAQQDQLIDVNN